VAPEFRRKAYYCRRCGNITMAMRRMPVVRPCSSSSKAQLWSLHPFARNQQVCETWITITEQLGLHLCSEPQVRYTDQLLLKRQWPDSHTNQDFWKVAESLSGHASDSTCWRERLRQMKPRPCMRRDWLCPPSSYTLRGGLSRNQDHKLSSGQRENQPL